MTLLGYAFFLGLTLISIALAGIHSYQKGHQDGYTAGKEEGFLESKRAEADWWIAAEKDVDREQQRMWRGDES